MRRRLFLIAPPLAALMAACGNTPNDADADVQRRMVGTWLREYQEDGVRIRRVVVLNANGMFTESSRFTDTGGRSRVEVHGGEWFFDGTNFKRKYTHVEGEPLSSAYFAHVTLELEVPALRHEIAGVDHVHRREVRYQRVPDGTAA